MNNHARKALTKWLDPGAAIMIACLFWLAIGLMAWLAVATDFRKGNPFVDGFVIFGAIGQVFFAGMLWNLSRQQFAHTRSVDAFQRKFATYALRAEAFDALKALMPRFGEAEISHETFREYRNLSPSIIRLYAIEIGDEARDLSRALTAMRQAQGRNRAAAQSGADAPFDAEQLATLRRKVDEHSTVLWSLMSSDLPLWAGEDAPEKYRLTELDIEELRESTRNPQGPGA